PTRPSELLPVTAPSYRPLLRLRSATSATSPGCDRGSATPGSAWQADALSPVPPRGDMSQAPAAWPTPAAVLPQRANPRWRNRSSVDLPAPAPPASRRSGPPAPLPSPVACARGWLPELSVAVGPGQQR